jgi:hypothetical protein
VAQFVSWFRSKLPFAGANVLVMVVLHGNPYQFWPKIPYLSLRDESIGEHSRLLFNTLGLITLWQLLRGSLPRRRWTGRLVTLIALPLSLPPLIWLGRDTLKLRLPFSELYNLALVVLLPFGAAAIEDALAA